MKVGKVLIGVVASAFVAIGAMAADIPTAPIVVAPHAPVAAPAFDWSGLYVGGFLERTVSPLQTGLVVGYNINRGNLVLGFQAGAEIAWGGGAVFGLTASAKAGRPVGERLLLYGITGIDVFFPGGVAVFWHARAGAEYALNNRISVFGEAGVIGLFNPLDCCQLSLRAGVNFRPGR